MWRSIKRTWLVEEAAGVDDCVRHARLHEVILGLGLPDENVAVAQLRRSVLSGAHMPYGSEAHACRLCACETVLGEPDTPGTEQGQLGQCGASENEKNVESCVKLN